MDILSIDNLIKCRQKYSSTMHLITADATIDSSITDYNSRESIEIKSIFAQVCYALSIQCIGGVFILKLHDCFTQSTIDIIYLLSSCYENVYIIKPTICSASTSEKYIICKGFTHNNSLDIFPNLYRAFGNMIHSTTNYISRFLNIPIYSYFIKKMEEYNIIFGRYQLENINYIFSLMDSKQSHDKILILIKQNIKKCIQWCSTNHISYTPPMINNVHNRFHHL